MSSEASPANAAPAAVAAPVAAEASAAAKTSSSETEPQQPPFTAEMAEDIQKAFKSVSSAVEAATAERHAVKPAPFVGAELPVRLVAVSKLKPVAAVEAAYAAGARVFGENYVDELIGKAEALPREKAPGLQWHLIGPLQSNKVAKLITRAGLTLECIEAVHSVDLARKLNSAIAKSPRADRPLVVFIQVNTSGEESKSGIDPDGPELIEIAKFIKEECKALSFRGLMTIGMPDFTSKPENFACLTKCRKRVAEAIQVPETALELSMGMSGDFANAIRMGSTNVRVGSTIFGARPKKAGAAAPAAAAASASSSASSAAQQQSSSDEKPEEKKS